MPTAQQLNQFVSQPINNLIVFGIILALVIVLGGIFVIWKFAPMLYNLYKQQADTNAKLTKIVEDGEKRASERTNALAELSEQTNKQTETLTSIGEKTDHQTDVLENMGKVFSDHQITTHDTVANLSDKVDSLEKTTLSNTESINTLAEQIKNLIARLEDKAACADAEERMRKLRDEMLEIATREQARRATDSQPAVNILPPNVTPDTASDADGANEKAAA